MNRTSRWWLLGCIAILLAVPTWAQPSTGAQKLDEDSLKHLTTFIPKVAKEGFREEFEILVAELEGWGLDVAATEAIRSKGRAALLKAKKDNQPKKILRELDLVMKRLTRDFDERPPQDQESLARALLVLDSTAAIAHRALGHENVGEDWLGDEAARCRRRRIEILEALRQARALELDVQVAKSEHPVLMGVHGPGTLVTCKGVVFHSVFDEQRACRIVREALRALAFSNYLLNGTVAVPEIDPRIRVWFNSRVHYEKAAKVCIAANGMDELYATYALEWGGYFQSDGTGVFVDASEVNATAVLFNYLRLDAESFHDTQAVLKAGHLNWVTRSYLGVPMAGGFWFEETGGGGPPKYDRGLTEAEEEERKLLLRMSDAGIAGSRAYLKYLVESGEAPAFSSLLLKETGMVTDTLLLKAIHVVEYLQERGDFIQVLKATIPGSADVSAYEGLFEKELGSLPAFDQRWNDWLLGGAPGILQRLGGAAEKRKLTASESKLLQHLDDIRRQSFGLMDWHRIPKIALNDSLSAGCLLHAQYLAKNPKQLEAWPDAHEEYGDCEGFTPEGCWAGMHSVIYPGVRDGIEAIDGWMGTFYHRLPLIEYGLIGIGYGQAGSTAVLDSGSLVAADRGQWIAVWPAPDATNVPCSFVPELPNPVPGEDQSQWGYPISLQCANDDGLIPSKGFIHLFLGGMRDDAIPCHFSSPAKPTNPDVAPPGAFCLIPKTALKPKTRYTVVAQIDDGPARTWSFTTGAK